MSTRANAEREVQAAYRWILGRDADPAGLALYTGELEAGRITAAGLRNAFFQCREFVETRVVPLVGQFLGSAMGEVECEGEPADMARMFSRIAEAWSRFGESAPHWSVLTSEEFLPDRIDAHLDRFYASGRDAVDRVDGILRRAGLGRAGLDRVVDFGCGVGRLSLAFAQDYAEVVGLDVSAGHLGRAIERARETGVTNARFEQIRQVEDIDNLEPYDLLVSFIVLQHNPPPVAVAMLKKLLARIRQGGVAVFQIPTFIDGYSFSIKQYLSVDQPQMEMNAVPQSVIFNLLAQAGFDMLEVREDGAAADLPVVSQVFAARRR